MVQVVIVEKNANCKNGKLTDFTIEAKSKKCGFRKIDGFEEQHKWVIKVGSQSLILVLFGKQSGRANSENKFDFPPPIDSTLFFGNMLILAYKNEIKDGNEVDLNVDAWCRFYEKLMGGFEDLGSKDSSSCEEDEYAGIPEENITKQGYVKDGFIVDSEEEVSDGEVEEELQENTGEETETSEEFEEEEEGIYTNEEYESEYEQEEKYQENTSDGEEEEEEEEEEGSELSEEEYLTE